jgi:bifunctional UDP-N-acetylglucosamine pyrophosphorylase/glucosamine-1-phosphate N-acetyltransferase
MVNNLISITLAGGKGTRMKSNLPKVLHQIEGRPLIDYAIETLDKFGVQRKIVVVGYGAEMVKKVLGGKAEFVLQKKQLGTGHAVMMCEDKLENFQGYALVSYGDMPFISKAMFEELFQVCVKEGAEATLLTAIYKEKVKPDWGRIVKDNKGKTKKIIEVKDATKEQLAIPELNCGVYCFRAPTVFKILKEIDSRNASGEYYLTDAIGKMADKGLKVKAVVTDDKASIIGINRLEELEEAKQILIKRKKKIKTK